MYSDIYSQSYGNESLKGKTRTHEWTREADLTLRREITEGLELSGKSGMDGPMKDSAVGRGRGKWFK